MKESETSGAPVDVVYLSISGVLHPSSSLYELFYGRAPEEDGHRKYEAVATLDKALMGWPQAKIVLTSARPWVKGLPAVLNELGPLAHRVLGHTFEDLTTRVPYGRRHRPIDGEDYWRLAKSAVVLRHVEWLKPARWVAVDDDGDRWPDDVAQQHLVLTDGSKGLLAAEALDRLLTVLEGNFGQPITSTDTTAPAAPCEQRFSREELQMLENVVVRHTPVGVGYVLFADLAERTKHECWQFAANRRGLLRLPSGEDAVFFADYKLWIASLGGACPED